MSNLNASVEAQTYAAPAPRLSIESLSDYKGHDYASNITKLAHVTNSYDQINLNKWFINMMITVRRTGLKIRWA